MRITDIINESPASAGDSVSRAQYKTAPPNKITGMIPMLAKLIAQGGEVSLQSAETGLQRAALIGWAESDGSIVAVRALKVPFNTYREKVFSASDSPNAANNYPYELGYNFVDPKYRQQGISSTLGKTLLSKTSKGVFSTTRSNNTPAIRGLKTMGFKESGSPYPSQRGDYTLQLWVNK